MNLRLYRFEFPGSTVQIRDSLLARPFKEDSTSGFVVSRSLNHQVGGRFFFRKSFEDHITSPLGQEETYSYTIYETFEFLIEPEKNSLVLLNPPRDLKVFVSALALQLDFKLTLEPILLDLYQFQAFLASRFENLAVVSLEIEDISFSALTKCRVLVHGREDVTKYIDRATYGVGGYHIRRLGLTANIAGQPIRIAISSTGTLRSAVASTPLVQDEILRVFYEFRESLTLQ